MRHACRALRRYVGGGWLLIASWTHVGVVALALQWLGFRTVNRWISGAIAPIATADDLARARRYARWIARAAQMQPIPAQCLARSLTLHWWLRREGAPSVLRIGVAKDGSQLDAHAWVELGGAPVNGAPDEIAPFTPLATVGSALPDSGAPRSNEHTVWSFPRAAHETRRDS